MLRSIFANSGTAYRFEGATEFIGHAGTGPGCTWATAIPFKAGETDATPPSLTISADDPGPLPRFAVLRRLTPERHAALARELALEETPSGRRFRHMHLDVAWGWPLRCLRCEVRWAPRHVELRGGGRVELSDAGEVIVPLTPMSAGLAIDTLLYGAAWMTLGYAVSRLLGLLRQRSGACRRCGYNLRGASHAQCPECGQATVSSAP